MKQVERVLSVERTRFHFAIMAASDDIFEEWRLDQRPRAARQIERVNTINECFIRIINDRNPSAPSRVVKNDRAYGEAALNIWL